MCASMAPRRSRSRRPSRQASSDRDPAFADEALQVVREHLLVAKDGAPGRIAEYRGEGPLEGWLRVAAVRAALRLQRQRKPEQLAEAAEAEPAQAAAALEP